MANEELDQRSCIVDGCLKGIKFGRYEHFNLGGTKASELRAVGMEFLIPSKFEFDFSFYKAPKQPGNIAPDHVFATKQKGKHIPVAVGEHKSKAAFAKKNGRDRAIEQAIAGAIVLGCDIAFSTDGETYVYADVIKSKMENKIIFLDEKRAFNSGLLDELLKRDSAKIKDPKPLAETVWQIVWHATKEEPKQCLLTFVEIFVLKFLSDNLPIKFLPKSKRFHELMKEPSSFFEDHGKTAIEYYVDTIRPHIKSIFPDNTVSKDSKLSEMFGLGTIVSKTSVINGFAFLRSSETTISGFNRIFRQILTEFDNFGSLTSIDPEFKLRLYETFLRKSARQQRLGQFFTPRNVVQQLIRMGQLSKLPKGSVLLDPAAGVGGFILEPMLIEDALKDNFNFKNGKYSRSVKTVGLDVDVTTHILAKANMLLHLAEELRNPHVTLEAINEAMAETFILLNGNETLGTLEYPIENSVDVILTNPPYVTQGSRVYKEEIEQTDNLKNGIDLRDFYDGSGLGVEALFVRYVCKALKPGGRAFIVVPLGFLNRTEPRPKSEILNDCNVIASIALPRNTFFNTSQLTYILGLEKRRTKVDERPDVICGLARSTGESLDHERVPTPLENDLEEITTAMLKYFSDDDSAIGNLPFAKLVSADQFSENDRWDVKRFWSDEELIDLGIRENTQNRIEFIDSTVESLTDLINEFNDAKNDLISLTTENMKRFDLNDQSLFEVRSGTRIRNEDIRDNPGPVIVYSCFKNESIEKGRISEEWLTEKGIVVEGSPVVTVNANGASIGKVFNRQPGCVLTDDVIIIRPIVDNIDLHYLAHALRNEVEAGDFVYEAKLFIGRVRKLGVEIPVVKDGSFDLSRQKEIGAAIHRLNTVRDKLSELGAISKTARLV